MFLNKERAIPTAEFSSGSREQADSEIASFTRNSLVSETKYSCLFYLEEN
jgi:hypothetical protein